MNGIGVDDILFMELYMRRERKESMGQRRGLMWLSVYLVLMLYDEGGRQIIFIVSMPQRTVSASSDTN